MAGTKLYVGNLPSGVKERQLNELMGESGPVQTIWIARNPSGYAFVTMEKLDDAEAVIRRCDGAEFMGRRLKVELSRAKTDAKTSSSNNSNNSNSPTSNSDKKTKKAEESLVRDGWFAESEVLWPGQRMALKVDKVLHEGRSSLQDVLVFQSATYGKVLVLDGVIQLTERDEFAYQEMIAHLPLMAHPNPRRVCIIGGGDGGVLREVCQHPGVEEVVMCEIDPSVVEVSKKHLGTTLATHFDDPRVQLLHEDGAKFLRETKQRFDVIIADSSDPVGPAETLFEASFFGVAHGALEPENGILCTQGECVWLHLDLIRTVMERCGNLFPTVNYAYTTIPTYPSGQIGFVISSRCPAAQLSEPSRAPSDEFVARCRYYSPEAHRAAFVLPVFAERAIGPRRKQAMLAHNVHVNTPMLIGILGATAAAAALLTKLALTR